MYTDVVGSMALAGALDGERWGYVLDRFLAIAAAAVHRFEGTISHFTGDGLLAVFGAPLAHEDHARRACLAVLELQARVDELAAEVLGSDGAEFATRCGLNSGEVVVGRIGDDVHMDFVPIGNTTALGKRIETLAPAGSAAMSAATAALVEGEFELRDLGEFELKGVEGAQRALELVGPSGARTRLEAAAATRGLGSFVGREAERAELTAALDQAVAGHGRRSGSSAIRASGRAGSSASSSPTAPRAGSRSAPPAASPTVATCRCCRCSRSSGTCSASARADAPAVARGRIEAALGDCRSGPHRRAAARLRVPRHSGIGAPRPGGRAQAPAPPPPAPARPDPRGPEPSGAGRPDRGGPALDRRGERRLPGEPDRRARRDADPAHHDLPPGVRRALGAARPAGPRAARRRRVRRPPRGARRPGCVAREPRPADRRAHPRQPVLHRGGGPDAGRGRSPHRRPRRVPARRRGRGGDPARRRSRPRSRRASTACPRGRRHWRRRCR